MRMDSVGDSSETDYGLYSRRLLGVCNRVAGVAVQGDL